MTTEAAPARRELHHAHRDVAGGWLRPAVFGAMDGLVSNVSLIAAVAGAHAGAHAVVLAGLAGLVAGAFSMAVGELISVSSQNALVRAEVNVERHELRRAPKQEMEELAQRFAAHGVERALARQVAEQISRHPEHALAIHAMQELGVSPGKLPAPHGAALASLLSFALGALVPLAPYLLGREALALSLCISGVAAFVGGAAVAQMTGLEPWRGGAKQLLLGSLAVAVTWLVGTAVGARVA